MRLTLYIAKHCFNTKLSKYHFTKSNISTYFLRNPLSPLFLSSSISLFIFNMQKFYKIFVQVCQENLIKLGKPNTLCLYFANQSLVLGSEGYPLPSSSSMSELYQKLPIFSMNFHFFMIVSLVTFAQILEALTTL